MVARSIFSYPFPRPAVTVDVAVFAARPAGRGAGPSLRVLLIQRGKEPFPGRWALPGGFVDADEDLADAARRELREETGLVLPLGPQLAAYGTPGRDPRGHTISVVYLAWHDGEPADLAGRDDAVAARWHDARRPPRLAFDHDRVLGDAVRQLGRLARIDGQDLGCVDLLPARFPSGAAVALCAAATGRRAQPALRGAVLRALRRCPRLREIPGHGRETAFARRRR